MKYVLNQRALFWFWKYCHFGCFGRVNKRLSNCYVLPQWKTETRTKFDSLLFTLPKQPKWSKATRHLVQDSGKNHNISTFYTVFVNAWFIHSTILHRKRSNFGHNVKITKSSRSKFDFFWEIGGSTPIFIIDKKLK